MSPRRLSPKELEAAAAEWAARERTIKDEGRAAFHRGGDPRAPYDGRTREAKAWYEGFKEEAEQYAETARRRDEEAEIDRMLYGGGPEGSI